MAARIGRLALPGRACVETPHYIAHTSRGLVPHLSQDSFRVRTGITAVYLGLEELLLRSPEVIERAPKGVPPVYKVETAVGKSPLREFVALPEETLLVLGARGAAPVLAPAANTQDAISICASVGFRHLRTEDYIAAAQRLRPDILIGPADMVYSKPLSKKRIEKMVDRTVDWTELAAKGMTSESETSTSRFYNLFVPILPVAHEVQKYHLNALAEDVRDCLSGLAIYDPSSVINLPPELASLPRLSLCNSCGPKELLREVSIGIDLFVLPSVASNSDAGIAFDFSFPTPTQTLDCSQPSPLGFDMWSSAHTVDLAPLRKDCACYTCRNHHRAYIHHLLQAKEMLAWSLLQIHNHHVMDEFLAGVRFSIASGRFEQDHQAFITNYEDALPTQTGQGPRMRGYQMKSAAGEPKLNPSAYRMLDDAGERFAEAVESDLVSTSMDDAEARHS